MKKKNQDILIIAIQAVLMSAFMLLMAYMFAGWVTGY